MVPNLEDPMPSLVQLDRKSIPGHNSGRRPSPGVPFRMCGAQLVYNSGDRNSIFLQEPAPTRPQALQTQNQFLGNNPDGPPSDSGSPRRHRPGWALQEAVARGRSLHRRGGTRWPASESASLCERIDHSAPEAAPKATTATSGITLISNIARRICF